MDFVTWLYEKHGLTWAQYDRLTDYEQRHLVDEWRKEGKQ